MDPFTIAFLLKALIGGAAVAAVVAVAFLGINEIRNYIRQKRTEKAIKEEAFIAKRLLDSGNIRVLTGFLDGDELKEPKIWDAERVGPELEGLEYEQGYIIKS